MKRLIAAAVSGGVDSLTAAFLLKKQGFSVTGLHFVTGYEPYSPAQGWRSREGTGVDDEARLLDRARKKMKVLSDQLEIPIRILDIREEFEKCVVDDFIRTYKAGKTPNPCLVCNPSIKFGVLYEYARQLGAWKIATGHYARVEKGPDDRWRLLKGVDSAKDQSYFLAFMNRRQLERACFPLGDRLKNDVKRMAQEEGLAPLTKAESQDVCFIREKSYGEFLSKRFHPKPGEIADTEGNILGEHKGLHLFTVGQRRGIDCPAPEPYYVVRIDTENNRLIVGFKRELFSSECRVESINWIHGSRNASFATKTRVRYRHREAESEVTPVGKDKALVRFKEPQEAITPGQGAVFYNGDEVVGAGWIVMNKN